MILGYSSLIGGSFGEAPVSRLRKAVELAEVCERRVLLVEGLRKGQHSRRCVHSRRLVLLERSHYAFDLRNLSKYLMVGVELRVHLLDDLEGDIDAGSREGAVGVVAQ